MGVEVDFNEKKNETLPDRSGLSAVADLRGGATCLHGQKF